MPTEAEQNVLIQKNMTLPIDVAGRFFPCGKNISFEELVAEGTRALVSAARNCHSVETFPAYAEKSIKGAIKDYIKAWQNFEAFDQRSPNGEKLIYEWQNAFFALYERWTSDPPSPESLLLAFEEIAGGADSLAAAFIGLSERDRRIIQAHFMENPPRPIDQIARDERISYRHTARVISRCLEKMRDAIKNFKTSRPSNVVAFPIRAPRSYSFGGPNNKRA
jgi:RNA polymerase sigma factor (sigma-70 family)